MNDEQRKKIGELFALLQNYNRQSIWEDFEENLEDIFGEESIQLINFNKLKPTISRVIEGEITSQEGGAFKGYDEKREIITNYLFKLLKEG